MRPASLPVLTVSYGEGCSTEYDVQPNSNFHPVLVSITLMSKVGGGFFFWGEWNLTTSKLRGAQTILKKENTCSGRGRRSKWWRNQEEGLGALARKGHVNENNWLGKGDRSGSGQEEEGKGGMGPGREDSRVNGREVGNKMRLPASSMYSSPTCMPVSGEQCFLNV